MRIHLLKRGSNGLQKSSPNRLQKLGVEDQLELAKVLHLRLARLGFEKLTISNQHEFAQRCSLRLPGTRRCSRRGMGAEEALQLLSQNLVDDLAVDIG